MSKTIHEYQYIPVTSQAEPAPKSDRIPGISYHARAALLIGICAAGIIFTIGWIFNQSWLKGSLVTGFLSGCIYGIIWVYWSATHEQRMATAELKRKWKQEDADKYTYEPEIDTAETVRTERFEKVCWHILRMHYIKKMQATRPQCEKYGITQPEWNDANALFKLIDLKGERGWNDDKSAVDAFAWFDDCTTFDRDAIYYSPTPDDKNLIRFLPGNA